MNQERLKQLLHYDPETGIFRWLVRRGPKFPGDVAGSENDKGYIQIGLDGKTYRAHRLAWLYMTGEWPKDEIDHRNRVPNHNWFDNLREAGGNQNQANVDKQKNNTSGYKGVQLYKRTGKWQAYIIVNRKQKHLGYFSKVEDAARKYDKAATEAFGVFANLNFPINEDIK